jgi:hypothetical protein
MYTIVLTKGCWKGGGDLVFEISIQLPAPHGGGIWRLEVGSNCEAFKMGWQLK